MEALITDVIIVNARLIFMTTLVQQAVLRIMLFHITFPSKSSNNVQV